MVEWWAQSRDGEQLSFIECRAVVIGIPQVANANTGSKRLGFRSLGVPKLLLHTPRRVMWATDRA